METKLLFSKAQEASVWALDCGVIQGDTKESVITGGIDGLIKIWCVRKRRLRESRVLTGHRMCVVSVALNKEKTLIGSSALDATLRIWDAKTGEAKACMALSTFDACNAVFTNDSKYLVVGGHHGKVRLFSVERKKQEFLFLTQGVFCTAVAISPDGKYIASADENGDIFIFDYATEKLLLKMVAHLYPIRCLNFSPDSKIVMTGSDDGQIHLFSVHDKILTNKAFGHTSGVLSCIFSENGKYCLSGSADKTVKVWDAFKFSPCLTTISDHEGQVRGACFLSLKKVVTVSEDKTLKMFRIKNTCTNKNPSSDNDQV